MDQSDTAEPAEQAPVPVEAQAAPSELAERPGDKLPTQELLDGWDVLRRKLSALLKASEPSEDWARELRGLATQVRELAAQDVDLALYTLVNAAGQELDHYSAVHAMTCAVTKPATCASTATRATSKASPTACITTAAMGPSRMCRNAPASAPASARA